MPARFHLDKITSHYPAHGETEAVETGGVIGRWRIAEKQAYSMLNLHANREFPAFLFSRFFNAAGWTGSVFAIKFTYVV